MNKGLFISAILIVVFLVSACTEKSETTEFYLVRHAEKAEWTNPDTTVMYNPELSEEGLARAQNFRELMADKEVDIIFSAEYKRNMGTIQPLAEYADIEIKIYHWYEGRTCWMKLTKITTQKHCHIGNEFRSAPNKYTSKALRYYFSLLARIHP